MQSSRLVSEVYMIAGQKIKRKYLMCQIPIKMLKQHATPNSSLHNLKIHLSKGCRKTNQRWLIANVCRLHSHILANTAILNIRIFSINFRIFRLCVFASTSKYFYYWHWRVVPNVLQSKWMIRPLKTLYIISRFVLNHHTYTADWLV